VERPFPADAVLLDAAAGRVLGPRELGLPEEGGRWVMSLAPSPDGRWLWAALDPIPRTESVQDPGRWGALVSTEDLARGLRLQGFTLGGWLLGISGAWLWENATGRLHLLRGPAFSMVSLLGLAPPVAEAPRGGMAVADKDPARMIRWDAMGQIREVLDLRPEYEVVVAMWSAGDAVFATAFRRETDGACRFGLIEIPTGLPSDSDGP
jgi:hypothetical protein